MKKRIITVISVIVVAVAVVALILPVFNKSSLDLDLLNKRQNDLDENLKITIQYEEVVEGKDEFDSVDSYIRSLYDVPENFNKIIRLSVFVDNASNYSFWGSINPVWNENVFIQSECVDTNDANPAPPSVDANSKNRLRLYAFVSDDLTETEIIQALEETEFSFSFYIDNSKNSMEPYNVTAKGKFVDGKAAPNPWTTPPYTG